MVDFRDIKFYKSSHTAVGIPSLGGAIDTASEITSSTPNNLLTRVHRDALIDGSDYYYCFYVKNTHATERVDNFRIWISNGTPQDNTKVRYAFDGLANVKDGAVGFDGTDDYIDCTNDTALWSKALTKFSFAMWIWADTGWDGQNRVVVSHGGGTANGFECTIDPVVPNRIRFVIKDGSGTSYVAYNDNFQLDEWTHVICSYDSTLGSENIRIYVNGQPGHNVDLNDTINKSAILTLSDGSNDLDGYMKDFRWWTTQSINDSEALSLYDSDDDFATEPSYHLNFGEGTGSPKDSVSGTKTATLTNGAFWKLNAVTISTVNTPPGEIIEWFDSGDKSGSSVGRLKAGESFPIWINRHVDPTPEATSVADDNCIFTIQFDIPAASTGTTGGGGSGGGSGGSGTGTGGTGTTVTNWKIAFAGDWGNTSTTSDVIDMMKTQDYDLIVGVGDNAYDDSSASSWCNKFGTFKSKMESAFGNHEYEESGGTSPYKSFFGYSKTYNSFRFQNCLILLIDSNDDKSGVDLDAQKTWAKGELEKYKNDANVDWRIAVMHHPWFGHGSKHTENEFSQVQKFHKMFTDYHVNFVIVGHNHQWVRSHQVAYDSGSPRDPNVVDSSSPYSKDAIGLLYIVTGGGGHDSPPGYGLPDSASYFAYRNNSHNGVHELIASNNGQTITGKFRDEDGNTYDTFTIS